MDHDVMVRSAASRAFTLLAAAVRAVAGIIAALILVHAVFVLFQANPANVLVEFTAHVRDTFGWFTTGLFSMSRANVAEAINDALAAVIYLVVGSLVSKLIVRLAPAEKARSRS
jgi:hypothetical protein